MEHYKLSNTFNVLGFFDGEGSFFCTWMDIKCRPEQQRSEKFYLQRRKRKGRMGAPSRLDSRFYSFSLPVGGVCFSIKILEGTGVSWEGDRAFLVADSHLWGTHGPPAVHPSHFQ
jgi:hypothetical protein